MTRTHAEVLALSSAVENYKIDNGKYPSDPNTTERLQPGSDFDPASYVSASEFLYRALSGDSDGFPQPSGVGQPKSYFTFKRNQTRVGKSGRRYIVDPWGNSYGYSTFKVAHPESNAGNNSAFDFWSTGGGKSQADKQKWTTNW